MASQTVVVVGGGLAGLAAAMKLAELGVSVDLISLVPVKRSHSVCAQGGINSVNPYTRQMGDHEDKHLDDTVYGGDFLQHQPPVKEMVYWGPRIIDLMDRLGVPFNRTQEGYRDQRRFGGTLFKRTAFAGATTGQQLLYALDEQVRRWESEGKVKKYESWDFLGPMLNDQGTCVGCVAQNLVTMEIRAFPAAAVVLATGGCGLVYGRSTMSMACNGSAASRAFQAGAWYANGEFIQVHPTAVPGTDKLRLMSESARGEGGRVWVPRTPQDGRNPTAIPESDRYYFLEERFPKYGNLVPRDIATREIFKICVYEGLSVERERQCVYLDLTHLPKKTLDLKLGGILDIYEKFQGVDPRTSPMKIFPAVHYSMGGLWCDYERQADGFLNLASPRNHATNISGLYAIGEADYQYHGANRLGANSLLSCIFSGLIVAPALVSYMLAKSHSVSAAFAESEVRKHAEAHQKLVTRQGGKDNPYALHLELGELMTKAATVVRNNNDLRSALAKVHDLEERCKKSAISDTGGWTNQNVVFTKALQDMFPLAKTILLGALQRDECRGAHYKPEFALPDIKATEATERRREAEEWCDRFEANNRKWLKTTVASLGADSEPQIRYEDVDVSLVSPRPRTFGQLGSEVVLEVWEERQKAKASFSEATGSKLAAAR